jgi:hypothetical protein
MAPRIDGNVRDWQRNRDMWVRILERQTGEGVDVWNRRIKEKSLTDQRSLRAWLTKRGVTGYAQTLLVMERFGYPDFLLATADQLIDGQYADRPHLKPIFDAIVGAAKNLGEVIIQARKTYVSLVSPRRTFARVQPTTRNRVDLGLHLERQEPRGRLKPSRIQETMRLQISLTTPGEVNSEVLRWLQKAYVQNC